MITKASTTAGLKWPFRPGAVLFGWVRRFSTAPQFMLLFMLLMLCFCSLFIENPRQDGGSTLRNIYYVGSSSVLCIDSNSPGRTEHRPPLERRAGRRRHA